MKRSAANFDKDAVGWSLSWHPDGRCDKFTREAILTCAPPTSGVYGLFNFDCQLFIGQSPNIQEALLRHESESDVQARHLRPTGFTFELCAAELRKSRADELTARFQPLLQTEGIVTEIASQSVGLAVSEISVDGPSLDTYDHHDFPVHEREKHAKGRRLFYSKWRLGATSAAILVASVVVVFYLGTLAVKDIQKRANAAGGEPLARVSIAEPSVSAWAGVASKPQKVSSTDTADGHANQRAEPTQIKSELRDSASASNVAVRLAAKSASAEDGPGIRPLLEPAKASPIADHVDSSKKWSVQISAAPAKDIAATLAQRLKANGYDGYVVQAEVKGQTYYRVRVGRFATREQAESVRESLAREESYRDAYLTGD